MSPETTTETTTTKTAGDDVAAENAKLKAQLAAISPKLDKLEAEEKKRADAMKKREEDQRRKEEGADKILEEKAKELAGAQERIAAYEKRERERVNKIYEELPEALREPIAAVQDKLSLDDWSELVEKQRAAVEKAAGETTEEPAPEADATGVFLRPGTNARAGKRTVSAMAAKILDETGHGLDHAEALTVKREVDKESGHSVTKFTRQMRQYIGEMKRPDTYKVLGMGPKNGPSQQPAAQQSQHSNTRR